MLIETLIASAASALFPVVIDGGKALVNKFTGGAQAEPSNFTERLQLEDKEIERLKAIAESDKPIGTPSQWVVDLRASARYVSVFLILANSFAIGALASIGIVDVSSEYVMLTVQMANSAFFFLFGDRVYVNIKNMVKKK